MKKVAALLMFFCLAAGIANVSAGVWTINGTIIESAVNNFPSSGNGPYAIFKIKTPIDSITYVTISQMNTMHDYCLVQTMLQAQAAGKQVSVRSLEGDSPSEGGVEPGHKYQIYTQP